MARLESIARAGYHPTPPRVVTAIARHLRPLDTGGKCTIRLLDPCAGTGAAAASLGQHLSAETFGIELNDDRAATAHEQLDHVLHTSAFSVRLANGAFSCLFLNPPYDYDDEGRRLEHAFLTSLTRALAPGGVLVFLVPQPRLAVSARYLSSHFDEIRAYRFPDPDYRTFRQVVLFGLRKGKAVPDPASQAAVEAWSHGELEPLSDALPSPTIAVPRLPAGDVLFASLTFDPRQAAMEAQSRGLWAQPELIAQLWPSDEQPVRPLMPLRRGHLALLVAAGLLNNCTLCQGQDRVLVKGRTYKEMVQVDSDDEDLEVRREVIRTSIAVLNLGTGALEIVEQDSGPRADSAGQAA